MANGYESSALDPKIEQESEETCRCQKDRMMYLEAELFDARKKLDEMAQDKVMLENHTKHLWKENADLQQKYLAKSKEAEIAENRAVKYKSLYNEISEILKDTVADYNKCSDRTKKLALEASIHRKQIDESLKNIEKLKIFQGKLNDSILSLNKTLLSKEKLVDELSARIVEWKEEKSQYHKKMDERYAELNDRIHNLESETSEHTARIQDIGAQLNRLRGSLPVVLSIDYFNYFI